jgi:hypothetical protein
MTELVFSTYLGGTGYDEIKDVAIDSIGNIYVTGLTTSTDFPFTQNAYDTIYNGGDYDIFLTKLSYDGKLMYSTYIGGSKSEIGFGISVTGSSSVYITGITSSADFPVKSAYQDSIKDGDDVFLLKFDILDNTLVFSTYLGGNGEDKPLDIKPDNSENIYVCGYTKSSDFPVFNTINSTSNGKQEGFITKFRNNGEIIYSRLIGGNENDGVAGIDVNDKNELWFTGNSSTTGFACSENAFYSEKIGGYDIILGKLNEAGDSLLYFSYFGSEGTENIYDFGNDNIYHRGRIKIFSEEMIVITGITNSSGFPVSGNAYDKQLLDFDIFVSVLDPGRKEVLYSTYLGGSGEDGGDDLAALNDSTVFIAGSTGANDFPVTLDAYSSNLSGSTDEVFARFKFKKELISAIKEAPTNEDIKIFPNPTSCAFAISFGISPNQKTTAEIYSLPGSLVFTDTFYNKETTTVDLSGYPNGIFLVKVFVDGKIYHGEICKQ